MNIICLMGDDSNSKELVENNLEQMDYKKIIQYTTKKPSINNGVREKNGERFIFVSKEKFMELVNKGYIIHYEEHMGALYGTPSLFGSTRYVGVLYKNSLSAFKELYGNQVLGVYLTHNKVKENELGVDVIINANQPLNKITADILKACNKNKKKG